MQLSLSDPNSFRELASLVANNGIRYFVETNASDMSGVIATRRLQLHGFIHFQDETVKRAPWLPELDVYQGDIVTSLHEILPKLDGPTFFWLDRSSPTWEEEMSVLESWESCVDWFVDTKTPPMDEPLDEPSPGGLPDPAIDDEKPVPVLIPVDSIGRFEYGYVASRFDRSEEFDHNWAGPEWIKPTVYRTQSEKDTWYAIAVENEYRLGVRHPDGGWNVTSVPDIAGCLEENDVVIDIGAHIGSFSWLAWQAGSRRVHAFEIDPWHIEAAKQNLSDGNTIAQGIDLYHAAVVRSDAKRLLEYFYDGKWNVFGTEGIRLATYSLDEIITMVGGIRFLKIDCEGSEWPILYTCTKLDKIEQIAGEWHTGVNFHDDELPAQTPEALWYFLKEKGFTEVSMTMPCPTNGNFYARRPKAIDKYHEDLAKKNDSVIAERAERWASGSPWNDEHLIVVQQAAESGYIAGWNEACAEIDVFLRSHEVRDVPGDNYSLGN